MAEQISFRVKRHIFTIRNITNVCWFRAIILLLFFLRVSASLR
jgi:hypothetical protein